MVSTHSRLAVKTLPEIKILTLGILGLRPCVRGSAHPLRVRVRVSSAHPLIQPPCSSHLMGGPIVGQ